MGIGDKIRNKAQAMQGRAKQKQGEATGDDSRRAEGSSDQSKADLKQAGEKAKDAFKKRK